MDSNIRGAGSTLDSMMSVVQIMTVKVVSAQNDATHYGSITIDGAETELWVNSSPNRERLWL